MTNGKKQKGFTLIEVLIAIVIFGMVISLIFASFKEIAFSAKIVDQSSKNYEIANTCLLRMVSDLESVFVSQKPGYVEPEFNSEKDPYRFEGGNSTVQTAVFPVIRFTSRAHLPVDRDFKKGIAEIIYYVDEDENGDLELKRSDRIVFDKDFERKKTDPVLCKKIKKMEVKYHSADGESFEDWDSESEDFSFATPSYVSVSIETGEEDNSFSFGTRIALRSVRPPKEEK